MSEHYVVYWREHLRDGIEEGAKVLQGLQPALDFLNKLVAESFAADNMDFKLFQLGEEIPLTPSNEVKKTVTTTKVRKFSCQNTATSTN